MSDDTRGRILDAAEKLFARDGFDGTSVRAITSEAGVNLAAAHYHFGSKEELIRKVFARRIEPLNQDRLKRLDRCLAEAGHGPPPLERIVEAFVMPALDICMNPERGGTRFTRLMGRAHGEPGELVTSIIEELFQETVRRFSMALSEALPQCSRGRIHWKMCFLVGAMAFTLASPNTIRKTSRGLCDPFDPEEVLSQMVPFIVAGLKAPVPEVVAEKEAS